MKKLPALLMAMAMVFVLCACGSKTQSAESVTGYDPPAEGVLSPASADNDERAIRVGLIALHDENASYDTNFIDAFKKACEACGVEGVIRTNVPETEEAYEVAAELAQDGCSIVIADSYAHQPFILEAAQEFPEVQFTSCTGDMARGAGIDNYHNAFADIYQGRFLTGVAAGMKLNEMIENGEISPEQAKLGYVGARIGAEVKSGYTAFFLGARYICPSATMEVMFTGSWYDESLEMEYAKALIDDGCVLISQHADSMGAPMACQEAGVPNVAYNVSTMAECPDTYLISSRINWTPYFTYIIHAIQEGEDYDTDFCGKLSQRSVELLELNEAVAAKGTAEKLEEIRFALMEGSIRVFDCSAWTVDGRTLDSYDRVAFYEGNECIWNGYFHESETRSAPYFDLDIDGITIR